MSEGESGNIGNVAHIYAESPQGPRGSSDKSAEYVNSEKNGILMCPTHHTIIDKSPDKFPAEVLFDWKKIHEKKIKEATSKAMLSVGFKELEQVIKHLSKITGGKERETLDITPLVDKINRNKLQDARELLLIGSIRSREVKEFVQRKFLTDSNFTQMLKSQFVEKYRELKHGNITGDEIFEQLVDFAAQGSLDDLKRAAAIAVITYLFEICEVFEK